jgi:protein ImuB
MSYDGSGSTVSLAAVSAAASCSPRSSPAVAGSPVSGLGEPDLADLLVRLGIRTLGAFAALPAASVVRRFGQVGELAHLRARVEDERLAVEAPPAPLVVRAELGPPADRVDTASFFARGLADELVTLVEDLFIRCAVLVIEAETEHGEALSRRWRSEEPFSAWTIVERVR